MSEHGEFDANLKCSYSSKANFTVEAFELNVEYNLDFHNNSNDHKHCFAAPFMHRPEAFLQFPYKDKFRDFDISNPLFRKLNQPPNETGLKLFMLRSKNLSHQSALEMLYREQFMRRRVQRFLSDELILANLEKEHWEREYERLSRMKGAGQKHNESYFDNPPSNSFIPSDHAQQLYELNLNVETLLSYKNDCVMFRKISFKKRELELKRTFKSFKDKLEMLQKDVINQSDSIRLKISNDVRKAIKEELLEDRMREQEKQRIEDQERKEQVEQEKRSFKQEIKSFKEKAKQSVKQILNKQNSSGFKTENQPVDVKIMPMLRKLPENTITYENNLIMCLPIDQREVFAFGRMLTDSERIAVGRWWIHSCYLDRSHMLRMLYFSTNKFVIVPENERIKSKTVYNMAKSA
jgi:flagellar biosynthesis GTPase FlhF